MEVSDAFWEPINFNETPVENNHENSNATVESNSMDGYSNAINCEVVMETESVDNETADNTEGKPIRANVRPNHHRKYYQISKKELQVLLNRNDKNLTIKENSSRKPELVYNYRRVCYGEKETEFVQCIHCSELLCYSSYDGTTSVSRLI